MMNTLVEILCGIVSSIMVVVSNNNCTWLIIIKKLIGPLPFHSGYVGVSAVLGLETTGFPLGRHNSGG